MESAVTVIIVVCLSVVLVIVPEGVECVVIRERRSNSDQVITNCSEDNNINIVSNNNNNDEELILVHVIHRHGGRTRDVKTYPLDPYINETFYPYGHSQLTKNGRKTLYKVGSDLRDRYNNFLGDVYHINAIEPFSTDTNRTKMSLLLSLSGLYPPSGTILEWKSDLNWQPIPYNYGNDDVVGDPIYFCPKYNELWKHYSLGEGLALHENDLELYEYCSEHTGWNITEPEQIYDLYKILISEYEYGLKLPEWTDSVWKQPLYDAAAKRFIHRTGTTELKKLSGGWFLKKLMENTINKINGTLRPPDRKLFLYSGHETNIGIILSTLGIFDNEIPGYGSQIIFEVYCIQGQYGFKVWYNGNREGDITNLITLPGCEEFCPLEKFLELYNDVIPRGRSDCDIYF